MGGLSAAVLRVLCASVVNPGLQGSRGFRFTTNETDPSILLLCASPSPRLCVEVPLGTRSRLPCVGRLTGWPASPFVSFVIFVVLPGGITVREEITA